MDTNLLLLVLGVVIVLSFFFNNIAKRTNIPAVLMLMILGYGIGYFVPQNDTYTGFLQVTLSLLGTIGVILIVLEASLDLHLDRKKMPMILAALGLAASLLGISSWLITLPMVYLLGMGWLQAWLYSVPLAVMSSAIIIPSIGRLSKESKEFLTFEAAFSDIFGIILFYALAGAADPDHEGSVFLGSLGEIIITGILSLLITYGLVFLFKAIQGHVKLFFLIAVLLALYGAGKWFHLSPLLLILVFGLSLNNKSLFFPERIAFMIDDEIFKDIVRDFRVITLESSFLVRTFFFVVFGMSIELTPMLDPTVWIISGICLAAIYLTRVLGLKLIKRPTLMPELFVAPRGLITVLLFYSIPLNMEMENFNKGILVLTILFTSFVMTFGLIWDANKQAKTRKSEAANTAASSKLPPAAVAVSPESDLE